MKYVKIVLYWLSVIRPIIDAVKGAIAGVKKGHNDVKNMTVAKLESEQQGRFDEANR